MSVPSIAFVAGATGYTGREVVRQLTTLGIRTVAHVRPDSPRLGEFKAHLSGLGAEVDSTPWEAGPMSSHLVALGPSHVFALLGITRARARAAYQLNPRAPRQTYDAIDYGLTAMLIDAAAAATSRPRFVYLSSAGVKPDTSNQYLKARVRAEARLRESGLSYVIARPSFITGDDRDESRPLERMSAKLSDSLLGLAGKLGAGHLRDRYRSTTNAILADALVRLALDPAAENGVFESEMLRPPGNLS